MAVSSVMLVTAIACTARDDERSGWLRNTLVLDNQDFFERDAELAKGKLARMADTPFGYFRGSAAQLARDLFEPGGAASDYPWRFTDPEVDDVALVGDPHPENIGGFRTASGTITVDFNDFDAATYGPFELDLRRLALGFWIACAQVREDAALDDAACTAITAATARGYADEIDALDDDPADATIVTDAETHGAILDTLLGDAREHGDERKPLEDYSDLDGDRRTLVDGELEPARLLQFGEYEQVVLEDALRPVSEATDRRVRALVEAWRSTVSDPAIATPATARVLDVARRYGAGVSSYPVLRYYVLVDGASEGPEDDVLLELKEVRDPIAMPGLRRPIDAPYPSNGERIVAGARELQGLADQDPWLGWADDGGQSFRMRERSGYQNGFEVGELGFELAAGTWSVEDVEEFADTIGRMLARSHARARRARGTTAGAAIEAAIDDDRDALVDDVVAFAEGYGPVVLDDHQRLRELIAAYGPDLGYGAW